MAGRGDRNELGHALDHAQNQRVEQVAVEQGGDLQLLTQVGAAGPERTAGDGARAGARLSIIRTAAAARRAGRGRTAVAAARSRPRCRRTPLPLLIAQQQVPAVGIGHDGAVARVAGSPRSGRPTAGGTIWSRAPSSTSIGSRRLRRDRLGLAPSGRPGRPSASMRVSLQIERVAAERAQHLDIVRGLRRFSVPRTHPQRRQHGGQDAQDGAVGGRQVARRSRPPGPPGSARNRRCARPGQRHHRHRRTHALAQHEDRHVRVAASRGHDRLVQRCDQRFGARPAAAIGPCAEARLVIGLDQDAMLRPRSGRTPRTPPCSR